ncbi:ENR1 protein, partial [Melanocharis versteri]|nr:ENR1 protein [Melanocharis versteri]
RPTEQLYQCWELKSQPYSVLPRISKYWTSASTTTQPNFWEAPQDLHWICGKKAYARLPTHWHGSCTLGAIQPNFFLLSEDVGKNLGVPL